MKIVKGLLIGLYTNILLVILLLVLIFMSITNKSIGGWILLVVLSMAIISGIFNIVFGLLNIWNTFQLYKNSEYEIIRKRMKVLKFGSIPFFIINFLVYFLLFFLFLAASRGILLFTPIPLFFIIFIFFTYLVVLFTSSYGIGFLAIIKRKGRINTGSLIIHILLQLCFVLDVFDTFILLSKYKKDLISGIRPCVPPSNGASDIS